ncbi:MAG: exodeoxyribonuclease III [Deltaproteobacteria bacterium]|nr:exodeoxyribonuclease III [Deltaproteobacteria bacterium]
MTRIVSWNVNGLRSLCGKGFVPWFAASDIDLLGMQETRLQLEQLPAEVASLDGYHAHWSWHATKKGYSGVGLLSRVAPLRIERSIGVEEYDLEGRVLFAEFASLMVANVYFPNGGGKNGDNSRVPFKLAFYERLFAFMAEQEHKTGKPALIMGDLNTAHHEIDIARPKDNLKTSGFLPEEREHLTRMLALGWVDTFRALHPDEVRYSWWSPFRKQRDRKIGWRLDYVLARPALMPHVKDAFIQDDVTGSDHCPVGVVLDLPIDGAR